MRDAETKEMEWLVDKRTPGTATIAQAGTWILAALVWAAVFEADFSFFSYHPVRLAETLWWKWWLILVTVA